MAAKYEDQIGRVHSVNISKAHGQTKSPVPTATINGQGLSGDAHSDESGYRQVSLMAVEDLNDASCDRELVPGALSENITTEGIDLGLVAPFDLIRIGEVELEVTELGKDCYGPDCPLFKGEEECAMPSRGLFCRVLKGGDVSPGDKLTHVPVPLALRIVTLSDRAARGEYRDHSGPRVRAMLHEWFEGGRWHPQTSSVVLPDDRQILRQELIRNRDQGTSVVFTTGGTGVGPREITVDVVTDVADKLIPGIMEYIRVKYGAGTPNALLSRSVAATSGKMAIFTLPGNVKAVEEYMTEILPIIERLMRMLRGLGHG